MGRWRKRFGSFTVGVSEADLGRSQFCAMGEREASRSGGEVDENQPDSKKVFGLEIAEVVGATARVYGKVVEDLRRKRRGEENEARSMAMYLSRVLGGHKHSEIGGALNLGLCSKVT